LSSSADERPCLTALSGGGVGCEPKSLLASMLEPRDTAGRVLDVLAAPDAMLLQYISVSNKPY